MMDRFAFRPKDFVETEEGFLFALLDGCPEDNRIPAVLRYIRAESRLVKQGFEEGLAFLSHHAPDLLYRSSRMQTQLAGVPLNRIIRRYSATQAALQIFDLPLENDPLARKARACLAFLLAGDANPRIGITGSLLVGAHGEQSDIDLVVYEPSFFKILQSRIKKGVRDGFFSDLQLHDWQEAYDRRACSLSFETYLWHEKRKWNKGLIEGTKFDLTLAPYPVTPLKGGYLKKGTYRLEAEIQDAEHAFESPGCYRINDPWVTHIYAFTHTFVGQAKKGERIEAQGILEVGPKGDARLIIGTSREAQGEWIRVIPDAEGGSA